MATATDEVVTEAPELLDESPEVVVETSAPDPSDQIVSEEGNEYDFDDGTGETLDETPGESDPPAESAESDTEPADSGVVDDGESFPPELLKLTGLDETRAKAAFGTPDRLESAWLSEVMRGGTSALQQQQQALLRQHRQQPSSSPPEESTAPTQQEVEDYLRLNLKLPEGMDQFADTEFSELLFNSLSQQVGEFYGPHVKRLEEGLRQQHSVVERLSEAQQSVDRDRHDEAFDAFIRDLPEQWHELLGKERPSEGTSEFKARAQLFHAKRTIEEGSHQLGQQIAFQRALELGLRTAFPDKYDTILEKTVLSKRKPRSRLAQPTQRKGAPLSPEEDAIDALRAFRKEREGRRANEPVEDNEGEFI